MEKRTEIKIQVLSKPQITYAPKESGKNWARAEMQVWTGLIAGQMTIYADYQKSQKGDYSDIETLDKGEYIVDLMEDNGSNGIELTYRNPRLATKQNPQAQVKQ
jgi:hypothetical protein